MVGVGVSAYPHPVADPEFSIGVQPLGRQRQLQTWLCFIKCVCQNERIGTLWGDAPGGPPGIRHCHPQIPMFAFNYWP